MGEVQIFREEHVGDAADLYLKSMRGQHRSAPASLRSYFREIFLANPWVTEEITPLVYLEGRNLVGFLGIIPRPMTFRKRPIWAAIASQFMIDRELYHGSAAFELVRHLFRGPQELTFTDGAAETATQVWTAAGAQIARLYSFNWMRVLRPGRAACDFLGRFHGFSGALLRGGAQLVAAPLDYVLSRAPLGLAAPKSKYSARPATAAKLVQCIQEFRGREPLRPAYAMPDFEWLIKQVSKATALGPLRIMAVYDAEGAMCGSFVYCVNPQGGAYVLQIGWRRSDHFAEVLKALFEDAWAQGASMVKGQAIPQFLTTLSEQHCLFRQLHSCVIAHSREPEILNSLLLGNAAISRLDGECWLRFSMEPWT